MIIGWIFGVFIVAIVIGCPIAIAMFLATLVPACFFTNMSLTALAQKLFVSVDNFTLLTIPLFILAGVLMDKGGVSKRLVDFAQSLFGWIPGSLAIVTFFASAFFGAISGSSSATVAAIGSIMIPSMLAAGYPMGFALTTVACAGFLGVIVPPSITMVLYAVSVGGVSIGDVFMGGFIPGFILAAAMSIYAFIYGRKHFREQIVPFSLKNVWKTFVRALGALGMPVIILGGIYSGIFTPTESAAVAVIYGFIMSVFVYREMKLNELMATLRSGSLTTCVVMFIVATALVLSYLLTLEQVPNTVAAWITSFAKTPASFWALTMILLLFVGTFMDTAPAVMVLSPILVPALSAYGINSVHFGVLMTINLAIGMVTPPVGLNLYVAASLMDQEVDVLINRHLFSYIGLALLALILFIAVPQIVMFLPSLMK